MAGAPGRRARALRRLRTTVVFRSDVFNTTEARPHYLRSDAFGDDLTGWMLERLRAQGHIADEAPEQDDSGWFFDFAVRGITHSFFVRYRAGRDGAPGEWVGSVERARTLLGSVLLGRSRGVLPDAVRAIHAILADASELRDLAWHHGRLFRAGDEQHGAATPDGR